MSLWKDENFAGGVCWILGAIPMWFWSGLFPAVLLALGGVLSIIVSLRDGPSE